MLIVSTFIFQLSESLHQLISKHKFSVMEKSECFSRTMAAGRLTQRGSRSSWVGLNLQRFCIWRNRQYKEKITGLRDNEWFIENPPFMRKSQPQYAELTKNQCT